MKFSIENYFISHNLLFRKLDVKSIEMSIDLIRNAFDNDKKIITCGNGGSASTASHYVTDWNKMINRATGKKFRGISLCDNVGLLTAYANDLSYKDIFCGQLNALMDQGDLVILISGSGNSANVIEAAKYTKQNGGVVLGIIGYDGGELMSLCDHYFLVPSFDMQLCEDIHLMFGHMVMKTLCNADIEN